MTKKDREPVIYNPPVFADAFADTIGKPMYADTTATTANIGPMGNNESILSEALALVYGARSDAYGHPSDDYQRTGVIWGALLRDWALANGEALKSGPVAVPADLACLLMIAVKLSREVNRHGRDNLVDIAGYAACVERIEKRRKGEE